MNIVIGAGAAGLGAFSKNNALDIYKKEAQMGGSAAVSMCLQQTVVYFILTG